VCYRVSSGWPVLPHHDLMAGWLGPAWRHPEPERRPEGRVGTVGHHLRVAQAVKAQGPARRPVIEVPGDPVVGLARVARPLLVRGVAVVARGTDLLLVAKAPRVRAVRRRRPAACAQQK
jgi:hypothetical protein